VIDCYKTASQKLGGKREIYTQIRVAIIMTVDWFCLKKREAAINDRIM
jgi:hypothetical protein